MNITITCEREDPERAEADRLLPYLAKATHRSIEARDSTPERAIATVKGVVLHWLGDWVDPPLNIHFNIIRSDLRKPPP